MPRAVFIPPLTSEKAALMRASWPRPAILGMTRAARMPMMVTTSRISTSVKPWRLFVFLQVIFEYLESVNVLTHREHWQQHADENDADECGDNKEHERFGKGHCCFEVAVQIQFSHV